MTACRAVEAAGDAAAVADLPNRLQRRPCDRLTCAP
jgi:hypothetical protein